VTTIGYGDANVRDLIARARVMITDYSSIAFNMGFVHRPVVYFQFDADDYYLRHTERPGYFDYESHGFGPVTSTVEETVDAVRAVLSDELDPMYARRAAETFPIRDGQNSRRVYEAIVASRTPAPFAKAITPSPPERWSSLVD
jgi:CDP-glycerol glycerophosphotransferase (TagB/SpsB family)